MGIEIRVGLAQQAANLGCGSSNSIVYGPSSLENFRSFADQLIPLNRYACFVGANGAGKSTNRLGRRRQPGVPAYLNRDQIYLINGEF